MMLAAVTEYRDLPSEDVAKRQAVADEAARLRGRSPRQADHEPAWDELVVTAIDAIDDPLPPPELAPSPAAPVLIAEDTPACI